MFKKITLVFVFLLALNGNADAMFFHAGSTSASSETLTLNDFAVKKIFQRVAGGTSKAVIFTGTYSGVAPTTVEVQLINSTGGTVAQAWTALTSPTISAGSFTGTITVPQGGWYFWQARGKDGGGNVLTTTAVTTNKFGVGILVSCIGQSNMQYMFAFVSGSPPTPSDLTTQITGTSANVGLVTGDGGITLANLLQTGFNVPVGIVMYALSATALVQSGNGANGYWLDLTAGQPYPVYIAGLTAAGGDSEFAIWVQGEDEATASVSAATYETGLNTFIARLQTATGRNSSTFKFFGSQIGVSTNRSNNTWTNIRAAQSSYYSITTGTAFAGTAVDQPVSDSQVHYTTAGMVRMAHRYAQSVLFSYGLAAYDARGPIISGATRVVTSPIVKVAITPGAGTQLQNTSGNTSGTGLSGWIVNVNGSPVTISSTAFVEPNEVDLTLASTPTSGSTVTLQYLFGVNPINNGANPIVYDNTSPQGDTLGLPLLPTVGTALDGVIPVTQI